MTGATLESLGERLGQMSKNKEEIRRRIQEISASRCTLAISEENYNEDFYGLLTLHKIKDDGASMFSVAGSVAEYSLHSLRRPKLKSTSGVKGRRVDYDRKIYGIAKDKLINEPISK